MHLAPPPFWSISTAEMLQKLQTTEKGLTGTQSSQRLARYRANLLKPARRTDGWTLLIAQFKSPLNLILLFATGLSFLLHDPVNAYIILSIVLASSLLGFWQEYSVTNSVTKLLAMVQVKAAVLRDGKTIEIPVKAIVPRDTVVLHAGDIIPGDGLILAAETTLGQRTNSL